MEILKNVHLLLGIYFQNFKDFFIQIYDFSGNIIAPTFNFDVPKIKFGLVSFGN